MKHATIVFLALDHLTAVFLLPAVRAMSATQAISSILPKDYGYVFAGLFAVGVANTYLVVNVVRARTKFDIKPPILYATKEVRTWYLWTHDIVRHVYFRTRVKVFTREVNLCCMRLVVKNIDHSL